MKVAKAMFLLEDGTTYVLENCQDSTLEIVADVEEGEELSAGEGDQITYRTNDRVVGYKAMALLRPRGLWFVTKAGPDIEWPDQDTVYGRGS